MRFNAKKVGVLSTAAVVAGALGVLPSTAGAAFDSSHDSTCETPGSIVGIGASFQADLQFGAGASILAPDARSATGVSTGIGYALAGCDEFRVPGTQTIRFAPLGSGAGKAAVGAVATADKRHTDGAGSPITPVNFGAADEAPTQAQVNNAAEGHTPDTTYDDDTPLHTIAVAQSAVTVAIRLPDGCSVTAGSRAGRQRTITTAALEGAFDGATATTWSAILPDIAGTVTGTGGACSAARPVRAVRLDSSGTTAAFKRYLFQIDGSQDADSVTSGTQSWIGAGNTVWPSGSTIVRGAANGAGSQLDAASTQANTGAIAYADLATARDRGYGWDGTNSDTKFWVFVQRVSDSNYRSPATDNAQTGTKGANCTGVSYADTTTRSLPASSRVSWSNVDATLTATDYPICALTYELAFQDPSDVNRGINANNAASTTPLTQDQAEATKDYVGFLTGSTFQGSLAGLDYAALPANVLTLAQAGAAALTWQD